MVKKYAIDSNIFISASRLYYPFDVAPAFWSQLVVRGSNRLVIIDRIKDEILKNEDQLSEWLKQNSGAFLSSSSGNLDVVENYSRIISSVAKNPQYKEFARVEFANAADSWLCAQAIAYSYIIVTEEKYEPHATNKIKIPNICKEFGIPYINRLQLIRELGIKFE